MEVERKWGKFRKSAFKQSIVTASWFVGFLVVFFFFRRMFISNAHEQSLAFEENKGRFHFNYRRKNNRFVSVLLIFV